MAYKQSWQGSKEDAKAKVDAALALIKSGVEKLSTSDDWASMLRNMSRFHRYSFSNQILISQQKPNATYVAGFESWKNLGRYVKKGSKGIQILAPRTYRKTISEEVTDPATGQTHQESHKVASVYFRSAYVFDISDTEVASGAKAPLLITDLVKTLEGQNETASQAAEVIGAWLPGHGVKLAYEKISGGANGYYMASTQQIVLNEERPQFQQCKTLIHELAHLLLHTPEDLRHLEFQHKHAKSRSEIDPDAREVEAESTAFVVLNALGVDSGEYSFGYVANWSKGKNDLVTKVASRVHDCALYILDQILGMDTKPGEDTESEPVAGKSKISVEKMPVSNPSSTGSMPRLQGYLMDSAVYALEVGHWESEGGGTKTRPWKD